VIFSSNSLYANLNALTADPVNCYP
jgi:hypothetical protein